MSEAGGHGDSPASKAFASRLAKFAYTGQVTPPRRVASSRRGEAVIDVLSEANNERSGGPSRAGQSAPPTVPARSDTHVDASTPAAKVTRGSSARKSKRSSTPIKKDHANPHDSPDEDSPSRRKAKKISRPYAGPEVYAHLKNTPDHLSEGLDIIFCGINPGKKSAATGTHFAHPTNKFWRALHQSGLTPRLYAPSECHLLPTELNFGLTNLCGRPTAEQSELSTLEMRLNVYPFAVKMAQLRPRVICFVGKKIWDIFEAIASKTAKAPLSAAESTKGQSGLVKIEQGSDTRHFSPLTETEIDIKPELGTARATPLRQLPPTSSPAPSPKKGTVKTFDWYLPRSLRLPLPANDDHPSGGYCYFWVTPNTSGLERTPLAEQANIFAALRVFTASLKNGDASSEGFRDVDLEGLRGTSDKIRAEAIAKGVTIHPSVHALDSS